MPAMNPADPPSASREVKDLSSLTSVTGRRFSWAREEYPVPKSSIEIEGSRLRLLASRGPIREPGRARTRALRARGVRRRRSWSHSNALSREDTATPKSAQALLVRRRGLSGHRPVCGHKTRLNTVPPFALARGLPSPPAGKGWTVTRAPLLCRPRRGVLCGPPR
jgi:hypothetical protein